MDGVVFAVTDQQEIPAGITSAPTTWEDGGDTEFTAIFVVGLTLRS